MNQTALRPTTKNARHQCMVKLVSRREVKSQGELAHLLAESGLHVTQATLSRDLVELDAVKVRGLSGALVYAVPGEGGDRRPSAPGASVAAAQRLARLCGRVAGHGRGERQPRRPPDAAVPPSTSPAPSTSCPTCSAPSRATTRSS